VRGLWKATAAQALTWANASAKRKFRTLLVTDKFIFVRNPKTASTSINHLLKNNKGHGKHHGSYHDVKRPMRFCVVRNPYDRMVSAFNHFTKNEFEQEFLPWLTGEPHRVVPGIDTKRISQFYWCDGCTHVLRFENLREEFEALGLTDKPLPHLNAKPHGHYRHFYCKRSREIVEDRFAWEIRKFGYEF